VTTRTPLARAARQASKERTRQILLEALRDHRGDLDKVASDPRVGCDRRNLTHYARAAGLDLAALAEEMRDGS